MKEHALTTILNGVLNSVRNVTFRIGLCNINGIH